MKTIEFALYLSAQQKEQVSGWMEALKRVYNRGLALYEWRQYYNRYTKLKEGLEQSKNWEDKENLFPDFELHTHALEVGKIEVKDAKGKIISSEWAMSSPIFVEARKDKTKSWDDDNIELRHCCPIAKGHWKEEPLTKGYSPVDIRKPFAKTRYDLESDIPQVYVNDYLGVVLAKAWAEYLNPNRPEIRRPRYKRKRDRVNTIPCESFRAQAEVDFRKNSMRMPGLGWVHVPGIRSRLGHIIDRQKDAMRSNPADYPELQNMLQEREDFLMVARWYEQGQTLPEDPKGGIKKAINKVEGMLKKKMELSQAIAKLRELAGKRQFDTAIDHLCHPGAFSICRRGHKFYLQITVRAVSNAGNPRPEPVGVDVGLNLMAHTTNGIKIKHPNFSKRVERINQLKQIQAKMKLGSNNWHRIQQKISKIERKKTKAKRARQHYVAGWFVDANQYLAIKKFDPKNCVGRPIPVLKGEKDGYKRNGREEQRIVNNAIKEAALGQFVMLIKSKASDRGLDRVVESVACPPEATPREILAASEFTSGGPQSETAQNSTETREGDAVTPTKRGKSKRDSSAANDKVPALINPAHTPKQFKRRKRKPVQERKAV